MFGIEAGPKIKITTKTNTKQQQQEGLKEKRRRKSDLKHQGYIKTFKEQPLCRLI